LPPRRCFGRSRAGPEAILTRRGALPPFTLASRQRAGSEWALQSAGCEPTTAGARHGPRVVFAVQLAMMPGRAVPDYFILADGKSSQRAEESTHRSMRGLLQVAYL
jgi:hypothetical protein